MALNNVGDIFTEFLARNNRTTTDGFISDTNLKTWTKVAHDWAAGFRPWPMTQGKASTTFATEETPIFEGWRADSTKFIQVGGKRYQKLNFDDYQQFREETPDDEERVFSDFARTYYVNPNGASGTLVAYGHYRPILDTTDLTATTIFSGFEEEGNDAIVEYMTGLLKRREHLPDEFVLQEQVAAQKLNNVWNGISQEQVNYHTRAGLFKRLDVLEGGFEEDLYKRDQF